MALLLGDTVPNFTQASTDGDIDLCDFLGVGHSLFLPCRFHAGLYY
jgi:hypothetical protein